MFCQRLLLPLLISPSDPCFSSAPTQFDHVIRENFVVGHDPAADWCDVCYVLCPWRLPLPFLPADFCIAAKPSVRSHHNKLAVRSASPHPL